MSIRIPGEEGDLLNLEGEAPPPEFLIQPVWVGPENPHHSQAPRWYGCCRSQGTRFENQDTRGCSPCPHSPNKLKQQVHGSRRPGLWAGSRTLTAARRALPLQLQ